MTKTLLVDRAVHRRLRQCSLPHKDVFVPVAADHRQNLMRKLPDDMSTGEKESVLRALKLDFARHLAPSASGYLTDPEYGFTECTGDSQVDSNLPIIVALEKTGYTGSGWDRIPQLVENFDAEAAVTGGASGVKLLLYYHPAAANAQEKEDLARKIAEQCAAHGLPLFLEPLVYSPDPNVNLAPGSQAFEDAVVETTAQLSQTGPAVMKVQFPGGGIDAKSRWEAACRRLDQASEVPWVLLGAGVGFDEFCQQTRYACEAGASGVLVGRTIWGEAVKMVAKERLKFLTTTATERVEELKNIVSLHGQPWSQRTNPRA